MRVTRQVSQYLFWPTERLLGVDNPVGLDPRPQERGERLAVGEAGVIAEEPQLARLVRNPEARQHQPAKQRGENLHRQEVFGLAGNPPRSVWREAAARYDHVHMRMMAPTPTIP